MSQSAQVNNSLKDDLLVTLMKVSDVNKTTKFKTKTRTRNNKTKTNQDQDIGR